MKILPRSARSAKKPAGKKKKKAGGKKAACKKKGGKKGAETAGMTAGDRDATAEGGEPEEGAGTEEVDSNEPDGNAKRSKISRPMQHFLMKRPATQTSAGRGG